MMLLVNVNAVGLKPSVVVVGSVRFAVACPILLSERRLCGLAPVGASRTVEGDDPIYKRASSPRVGRIAPFSPGRNSDSYIATNFILRIPAFGRLASV